MSWYQKKGNKYNAKSCHYDGNLYDSKFEASYAQELDLRLKAKDIKKWERQIKISLDIGKYHICNYFVDFLIYHNDKSKELVETKGRFLLNNPVYRLKRKLLEAIYLPKHKDTIYTVVVK